jgi:transcriptional regulator with XRE-family HTH domain
MNVKKIFGENLKYYRKQKDLTQEEFAELIGIGVAHVGNLERGEKFISAELLEEISKKLEVSPSNLFYSPEFDLIGNNGLDKIDKIISNHLTAIKKEIRQIK